MEDPLKAKGNKSHTRATIIFSTQYILLFYQLVKVTTYSYDNIQSFHWISSSMCELSIPILPTFYYVVKDFLWTGTKPVRFSTRNIIHVFKANVIISLRSQHMGTVIWRPVVCHHLAKQHWTSPLKSLFFEFLVCKVKILSTNICELLCASDAGLKSFLSLLYLKTMFWLCLLQIYISSPQPTSSCIPCFIMWTVQAQYRREETPNSESECTFKRAFPLQIFANETLWCSI